MGSKRGLAGEDDDALGLNSCLTAMPSTKRQKNFSYNQYTLAWVCALHLELSAAMMMLDEVHDELPRQTHDTNTYRVGRIGNHNVVIACLPAMQYGTVKAATVVAHMIRTFPSIEMALMVGIGGGVPSPSHDIRLGDVVVGTRIMPYDLSKVTEGGLERTDLAKHLHPQAGTLVSALRARHDIDGMADFHAILQEQSEKHPAFGHPNIPDQLFHAKYNHDNSAERLGSISFLLNDSTPGSSERDRCAPSQTVRRAIRNSKAPEVHYGAVASGNQVIKDGISRDQYARDLSVICFEMESAGLMDNLPCIPIRGICDYSDAHKNKLWQNYAALAAASFTKGMTAHLPTNITVANLSLPRNTLEEESNDSTPVPEGMEQSTRRQQLLDSLQFVHIDKRRLNITGAHGKTCQWLLQLPDYKRWLDHQGAATHHGFFWIRGKPGAGKSTLMKFIYGRMREKDKRQAILTISFFFHARGGYLERSLLGMYQSLLFQLLEAFPDLQKLFDDPDIVPRSQVGCPSLEVLKSLLQAAVLGLGGGRSLTCYIDALDECDEQQISDMVRYFEDLSHRAVEDQIHLKICFSSRHYPYIDIRFGLRLTLEDMPGHTADLVQYIRSNLRVKNPLLQELQEQLLHKSAGVFLWVKLVVDILNNERNRGGFGMRKRLSEVPEGLTELFRDLIRRDSQNMEDFRLCILWLLCAKRPLSPIEYHHAIWAGLAMENLADRQPPESDAEDPDESVQISVVSSSKGLAEITKSTRRDKATVQFMHESVRDFLIKDGGLYDLWPDLGLDWESAGHERLKLCCSFYMSQYAISKQSTETKALGQDAPATPTPRSETLLDFPLLAYASHNMLYHADGAAKAYPQKEFIASLDIGQWVAIHNTHEEFQTRRYPSKPDLVYILADRGHGQLIRCWLEGHPGLNVLDPINLPDHRYRHPFFAALASGHKDAVAALLRSDSTVSYGCDIAKVATTRKALEQTNYKQCTPLTWAIEQGLTGLIQWLLASGADPEALDRRGRCAMDTVFMPEQTPGRRPSTSNPVRQKDEEHTLTAQGKVVLNFFEAHGLCSKLEKPRLMLKLLLYAMNHGLDKLAKKILRSIAESPSAAKDSLVEPLQQLMSDGQNTEFLEVVRSDLGHEVDVETISKALLVAARSAHLGVVELLLQYGADINHLDISYGTALIEAARAGRVKEVEFLLNHNANINDEDAQHRTALQHAVQFGHIIIVELLLGHKAEVEHQDQYGQTALQLAAASGRVATVELLLGHKAEVEHQDQNGQTALQIAAALGRVATVELLLGHKAEVEHQDQDGQTALQIAAALGRVATVELLLGHKAEVEHQDQYGQTALQLAAALGWVATVELLLGHKAEVEHQDQDGQTALQLAAEVGDMTTVELLIRHGANIDHKDRSGQTVLQTAVKTGNVELVELLSP